MSSEMIFYMYVRLFQIVKKHSKLKKGGKCKFKYTEKKIGQDVGEIGSFKFFSDLDRVRNLNKTYAACESFHILEQYK